MRLELPFPPPSSLPQRREPDGTPMRSEAYELWRSLALWQLTQQLDPPDSRLTLGRPVSLDIVFARPSAPGAELSDLAPALEELLVAAGLLPARGAIETLRLRWTDCNPRAQRLAVLATKDVRRHLSSFSERRGPPV